MTQSTFKVLNNQQHIYLFLPNPIEYSRYESAAEDIRMIPVNGKLETIDDVIFWTPLGDRGGKKQERPYLLIEENQNGYWIPIDTIDAGHRTITPDNFNVFPRPVGGFSHGHPDLLRFKYLKLTLPYEFSHLTIDSLCRVLSFDAIMLDSNFTEIDTVHSIPSDKPEILRNALTDNILIYAVRFENIHFKCKIWTEDRKYHESIISKSQYWSVIRPKH